MKSWIDSTAPPRRWLSPAAGAEAQQVSIASPPSGIVKWGADWTGKTIAGAKCIELPADFGGLPKGWSRCNWDIYRDIRVRNLPLALEEVRNTAGLLYHRIADYTTTRRENFLGGRASREVDWLPEGVPIEENVH